MTRPSERTRPLSTARPGRAVINHPDLPMEIHRVNHGDSATRLVLRRPRGGLSADLSQPPDQNRKVRLPA